MQLECFFIMGIDLVKLIQVIRKLFCLSRRELRNINYPGIRAKSFYLWISEAVRSRNDSGHFKKSGDGSSKVAWKVNIAEDGEYDIYYYHIQSMMHMRFRGRGRDRNSSQGKMYFQIHFNGEIEEVEFDLANTENGWNLLGTFPLSAGENRIELNDKNDLPFVTADAVKWVKRK